MNVIKWILIAVICKSHIIDEEINNTHFYTAHQYVFSLEEISNMPYNEAIIDDNSIKITISNISTLSFMIDNNISFNLIDITTFDDLSYKYPIFRASSTKRRRLKKSNDEMKSIPDKQHKLNTQHMNHVFNQHSERLQDQTDDLKTQILKQMAKGFEENDKKTALLTQIDGLKHQQKDLELQHKLLQSRKQQKKRIDTEKNKMIQQQIEWEKRSENERKRAIESKRKQLGERHELRVNEHQQLMKGLKAFLFSFDTLLREKQKRDRIEAKRREKKIRKETYQQAKEDITHQLEQQLLEQETSMLPWMQYMPQQQTINQLQKVKQPPRTSRRTYGGRTGSRRINSRRTRGKQVQTYKILPMIPPPLLPPIPPMPARRLIAMELDHELQQTGVIETCVLYESRDICMGYDIGNEMVLVNDIKSMDVLRDEMKLDVMDIHRYFVHVYEFRMEDVKMCDERSNDGVLPVNVCFSGENDVNDVVIYLEKLDHKFWSGFIQILSRLKFKWKDNNEEWDKVIRFDGAANEKRMRKCVYLVVMELCVENVVNMFEIQLKIPFNDESV